MVEKLRNYLRVQPEGPAIFGQIVETLQFAMYRTFEERFEHPVVHVLVIPFWDFVELKLLPEFHL
jgi:hypothetical protein